MESEWGLQKQTTGICAAGFNMLDALPDNQPPSSLQWRRNWQSDK